MATIDARDRMLAGLPPTRALDVARIERPTSLLWGRHDRIVPRAIGEAAAARHGLPLRVIEQRRHAPHIEQPDESVE